MHPFVLERQAGAGVVQVVDWHAAGAVLVAGTRLEDGRLVHVVPGAVQVGLTFEILVRVEGAPVLLSVLVNVVYPDRRTRPAFTNEV